MGIDHGLGGRDGVKSKQRREKKAKKVRAIALKALTGGKKREVIFDEQARKQYLTGFGKRKQERRKYGLAMEVLKKNKAHKEMVREQRNAFKEQHKDIINLEDIQNNDDVDDNDDDKILSTYEDPSTISMFGSAVSVVVNTSINLNDHDDEDHSTIVTTYNNNTSRNQNNNNFKSNNNHQRKELSKLDKALKIAKVKMNNKKKHKDNSKHGKLRSIALNKKVETSKLLTKAIGKHKLKSTTSSKGKRHR